MAKTIGFMDLRLLQNRMTWWVCGTGIFLTSRPEIKERRKNKSPITLFKDTVPSDINLPISLTFQRFCHLTTEPQFERASLLTHGPLGYTNPIIAKRQKYACHAISF